MKRIVSLWLPRFATDRLCRLRSSSGSPAKPFATIAKSGSRLVIAAVNAAAERAGIGPGQPLADARALEPGLQLADADPGAERSTLAALADWATRYSPWAAAEALGPGGGGGVLLDITGCAHLVGGEAALLADLRRRLERHGFAARAAVADSVGAAWAVARFAAPKSFREGFPERFIVLPGEQSRALAALPVAALRLLPDMVEGLERLGLRRIGDLYGLPRAPLARRFGPLLCRRLDQALGRLDEPISPHPPVPPWRLQLAFAEPISRREDIARGLERLIETLCRRLAKEMRGARRLDFALYRVDGRVERTAIGTSRPLRTVPHLVRLFREKLDGLDPGLGADLLMLTAPRVEPLAADQADLPALPEAPDRASGEARTFAAPKLETSRALAGLVDRLANRLGGRAVRRLVPVASHLPERAQSTLPVFGPEETGITGPLYWPAGRPRPLRLFTRPQPIDAIAPVPDDPPRLFRWRQQLHQVRHADGPERIAGEWWHDNAPAAAEIRDYYRVEDESGRRFWLYREGLYHPAHAPRWFLHGLFG